MVNPDLIATKYPLTSAAWFFDKKGLWKICDEGVHQDIVKKISHYQKMCGIPFILIMQEKELRLTSQSEIEKNGGEGVTGAGVPRMSNAPQQETSLMLKIQPCIGTQKKEVILCGNYDRFRGLAGAQFNFDLDSRGRICFAQKDNEKERTHIDNAIKGLEEFFGPNKIEDKNPAKLEIKEDYE
jgi:hypothetical protein